MKFNVIYDKGTRLRLRSGRYSFSEKKGYGICKLLLTKNYIKKVYTSYKNGSLLIQYDDIEKKEEILEFLDDLNYEDIIEAEPDQHDLIKNIENEFYLKLVKKLVGRALFRIFVPIPIKRINVILHAIPYLRKGLNSLVNHKLDVSLLDATAIGLSMYRGSFKSAGSLMFLLSISDLLEDYTLQRTKTSLKNSLAINVDTVWKVGEDGTEISVPLSTIKKGDIIKIRSGGIIPVDGTVVDGEAMINEASMTGEPLAVHRTNGATIHGGTVIEEGSIAISVTAVDEDTRINKIINLIEESESLKASVQSKAENLADSIVPFSFLATLLTYLITRDASKALAVIMVDYSCAIKLSTPLTIISAMQEASNHKIMVKGGKYLENFANADTIVFDKTGTLTEAAPKLAKIVPVGDYSRKEVLKISACIEEHFAHSVARAIVNQAKKEKIKHKEEHAEVEYIVAHGISTNLKGKKTMIGSKHFIFEDEKIPLTPEVEKILEEEVSQYSTIFLAIGGVLEGILCIEDPVRKEAKKTIQSLKELGIENVIMLTGDSENAAASVAKKLNISEYKSQVLPEDKAQIIEEIKNEGKKVIMVGDGINDSPALATADVSVAMRDSSDIAREVADVSLLSASLEELVVLRELSQNMLSKINTNYGVIVGVNTSLIALGVLGIISPSTSSLLHNMSTIGVGALSTRPCLPKSTTKT